MADKKKSHPRLKAAARIGGLMVGTAAFVQCASPPLAKTSDTVRWSIPQAGMEPDQTKLMADYAEAYKALEHATDDMLREASEQNLKLFGQVIFGNLDLSGGINVIFHPSKQYKPGKCYFTNKTDKTLGELPAAVRMFDAYSRLCRLQNQIEPDRAEQAGLSGAPTPATLNAFVTGRYNQMRPSERPSGDDLDRMLKWIADPLVAACTFTQTYPEFKSPRNDIKRLQKVLSKDYGENPPHYDMQEFTNAILIVTDKGEETFNIPPKEQLVRLQGQFAEGSFGRMIVDKLMEYPPPEKRASFDFKHDDLTVLEIDVPVKISVENPYFGQKPPLHSETASRSR